MLKVFTILDNLEWSGGEQKVHCQFCWHRRYEGHKKDCEFVEAKNEISQLISIHQNAV